MLSYPTESQKGLFIGVFWAIFNLGAVVGSSVSLGENFHSKVSFGPMLVPSNVLSLIPSLRRTRVCYRFPE
jgi:hypothetical protein